MTEVWLRSNRPVRSKPHPLLLVSVRNVQEAAAATVEGVDWIDLKEPSRGPLGSVDVDVAREVAEAISTTHPVSAAGGELLDWLATDTANRLTEVPGIRLIKLGLAGCAPLPCWRQSWQAAQAAIANAGKQLVAVAYADWRTARAPHPAAIVDLASECGCDFFLIDTFDKSCGTVLDHLPIAELSELLAHAQNGSLQTVVAGSLASSLLPKIAGLPIDLVAVRGAVCRGGRRGSVRREQIAQFRLALQQCDWSPTQIRNLPSPRIGKFA